MVKSVVIFVHENMIKLWKEVAFIFITLSILKLKKNLYLEENLCFLNIFHANTNIYFQIVSYGNALDFEHFFQMKKNIVDDRWSSLFITKMGLE